MSSGDRDTLCTNPSSGGSTAECVNTASASGPGLESRKQETILLYNYYIANIGAAERCF